MKDFFLTDNEIRELIEEPKRMSCSAGSLLRGMKTKQGRGALIQQSSLMFSRSNGEGEWSIYLRHNRENPFDFSCGLGFIPKGRTQTFTLRRYNGRNHYHTNQLENEDAFYDFHIHQATEKYQKSSYDDEHHARPTNLYVDIRGAFKSLLSDCKVTDDNSDDRQTRLFE